MHYLSIKLEPRITAVNLILLLNMEGVLALKPFTPLKSSSNVMVASLSIVCFVHSVEIGVLIYMWACNVPILA